MKHVVEIELAGRRLTLETGRIAKQADGAIWATYGDTVVCRFFSNGGQSTPEFFRDFDAARAASSASRAPTKE